MKMYHYSDTEIKEIDFSKCVNGFWITSISPDMLEEYESEIGFDGCKYCMTIEIDDDANYAMVDQDSARETIEEDEADYGLIRYATEEIEYEDAVIFNDTAIKSITVTEI